MSQDGFKKFTAKKKNSVVKEQFRQEKKQARKEKNAYFDKLKEEKYQARMAKKKGLPLPSSTPATTVEKAIANVSKPVIKTPVVSGQKTTDEVMPLNKFLAHCGVSSRRDAVELISKGLVKVNGNPATEPGYKVQPNDEIVFNGKKLFVTKNLVYILLNKPKDYITTTDDPQGRKTVLQLIQKATTERVYPIGRLDRNTSGVLLLTNDGDLTQKLSHPSYEIKKIYEVKLDKNLTKAHFDEILAGLTLEDGLILVDSLAYADSKDKSIIGIEIHSGRNRIVRRIFESLGYDVKGLDRVMYAGLTKKNVERSKWRYLSEKEIRLLKYMNESKKKSKKTDAVKEEIKTDSKKTAAPLETKKAAEPKLTDKEIAEAIGEKTIPVSKKAGKEKEVKIPKARKFKTHSEKKEFNKNSKGGKK
ncbi:pseudouridine synthase [Ferruginibacter sp. HRS2-29]|uniref:pseudouridine synthase n=1 Tax=Ferruginibacter sp. HRS2-29 TaxID=2487334 RepID=UPI0020CDD751|nr:pseudouridine synthase [Ferruginibacter sp. HRS2-29]MCP9751136.1 rRNA pseudouridine synthase [Ferruginibacter sp. HRS2-29]